MTISEVQKLIRATPFRPFEIHATDGRAIRVNHPEFIALGGRTVVVNGPEDDFEIIDLLLVTRLVVPSGPGEAGSNGVTDQQNDAA